MLESTSGTCALELETGTNHFLVAARVEFGTGNRHVPFFRSCPRSSAWSSPQSWGDNRIEGGNPSIFFLRIPWRGRGQQASMPGRRGRASMKPPNLHSPRVPCYMCNMCYILHAKPLNPHSPPTPCYTYYMCYIFCTRLKM